LHCAGHSGKLREFKEDRRKVVETIISYGKEEAKVKQ